MGKDILFAVNMMGRGGASRVISVLANHYAAKGWNVTLLLRKIDMSYALDDRITVRELGLHKLFRLQWIGAVREYVKAHPHCTVVSFQSVINVLTAAATRGLPCRVILSERNDIKLANPAWVFPLASWAYGVADGVVFQSERVQNYFPQFIRDKSTIILNPVSIACTAAEMTEKKIVNCGRLAPQKNQKLLIDAFAEFHRVFPEHILQIYGEGPLRKDLENQIHSLGLERHAFLMGNVSDIHQRISDAEMFVLSSDFEGLSNALLECMMMGIPCISTSCAGSDAIIQHQENGVLVPVGDGEALCGAMKQLAGDAALRSHIRQNGMRCADAFRYENVISQWEAVFENAGN